MARGSIIAVERATRLGLLVGLLGSCNGGEGSAEAGPDLETDGSGSNGSDGSGDDGEVACEAQRGPRQLRLLTRREYEATVRDLFGLAGTGCSSDAQCNEPASCIDGACVAVECPPHTFTLPSDGADHATVHVAGTFNDWAPTIAAGGLALQFDATARAWQGAFELPEGEHAYKFVLDEQTWVTDPTHPMTSPDGMGGFNSTLEIVCSSEVADPLDGFASGLPTETRPERYPFDNHAAAGLVTSVHVEQSMRAAERVAAAALVTRQTWLPCDDASEACARTFATEVGRRVFRRPLETEERDAYAKIVLDSADFEHGLELALRAMLVSPNFLYRFELGDEQGRLDDWEIATLFSYGLWGTTPDAELLEAADRGELSDPEHRETQVRRLLADPRAAALVGTFAAQWLGIEKVLTVDKQPETFPSFDGALRRAMLEETQRFVRHVVFEGSGRFDELLLADFTIADARLAAHYGLAPPPGSDFAVTPLDGRRSGVLAHGSVLASHAYSDQTSPVRRGLFVRRELMCQELPPPPPDAGGIPEVDSTATTRERFEQHSSDPACYACHKLIDGLGFGFEHFDPVGVWRDDEHGTAIDATGTVLGLHGLSDAEVHAFGTVPELAELLASSRTVHRCFAEQWFRFTSGRLLGEDERCAVDEPYARFEAAEFDVIELLVATLTTPAILERQP